MISGTLCGACMPDVPFAASSCAPAGSPPRRSAHWRSSGRRSAWTSTVQPSEPRYGIRAIRAALPRDRLRHGRGDRSLGGGESRTIDYLGIEVHRSGVGRLLLRAARAKLANLRVVCHDAVEVLRLGHSRRSFDSILIFFPDPWHKKRHHKRRLIDADFVEIAGRTSCVSERRAAPCDRLAGVRRADVAGVQCLRPAQLTEVRTAPSWCGPSFVRRPDSSSAGRASATACGIWLTKGTTSGWAPTGTR